MPGAAAAAPRAITLEQALALAGTSNLELRASEKEVERASADARSAAGLLGPRLSVDDTLQQWNSQFLIKFGTNPPILARDQFTNSLTLSATQPLIGLYPLGER